MSSNRSREKWPLYLRLKLTLFQDHAGTVTMYPVFKTTLIKMYGSMKQIYLQRTLPSSFLGKTLISHFSGTTPGELDWSHFASKLPSTTGYWRKDTRGSPGHFMTDSSWWESLGCKMCTLNAYKDFMFVIAFCVLPHYYYTLNLYFVWKPNSFCEDCCFLACMSDVMVTGWSML